MNCLEFRRARLADPCDKSPDLTGHASLCPACREFEQVVLVRDARLRQALQVDVPDDLAARILFRQSLDAVPARRRRRWTVGGIAASVVLALGFVIMRSLPVAALDRQIADHLDSEKQMVAEHHVAVSGEKLRDVLGFMDMTMDKDTNQVQFARICIVDYRLVAHLVVFDRGERFTLLLMPQPPGDARKQFITGGWHGVIVPRGSGSLAVVADHEVSTGRLQEIAHQFTRDIRESAG